MKRIGSKSHQNQFLWFCRPLHFDRHHNFFSIVLCTVSSHSFKEVGSAKNIYLNILLKSVPKGYHAAFLTWHPEHLGFKKQRIIV
jgi:hypothetical protein